MTDTRYVYGANCTWHGSIADIGHKKTNSAFDGSEITLPCCPHCGGMLFEFPSKEVWGEAVAKQEAVNPGYAAFIEWAGSIGACWGGQYDALKRYNFTQGKEFKFV